MSYDRSSGTFNDCKVTIAAFWIACIALGAALAVVVTLA